jgi:glycosyltransferase involved in cell wall biosynthesis
MLGQALASALAQQDVDLEVVVSDNASTDHTAAVVAAHAGNPRLRYFRNETNLGMVANWRLAIYERTRAPWFVLLSDDDYFTDMRYLSRAVQAMREHEPRFVYAGGVVDDVELGPQELRLPFSGLVDGAAVLASRGTVRPLDMTLCNMVFRVADARRLGFMSDPWNLSGDSQLYLMLCCEGPVFAFPEPVSVYRRHGHNLVERINRSRRLMSHNLDHLVVPYAYALQCELADEVIAEFRTNARIDDAVRATLLIQYINCHAWYAECRERLLVKVPELVREIEGSRHFALEKCALALCKPLLRRRYRLDDSDA